MHRIVIFGNSGSGKSTLAQLYATRFSCMHLDLDALAWEEDSDRPKRKPLAASERRIHEIIANELNWVVEGCYSDLLSLVIPAATEIVFLNPGVQTCIENCRNRPWEPHKYSSPAAQQANLEMLIEWIRQYAVREDEFSLHSHQKLFAAFARKKVEYTSNAR